MKGAQQEHRFSLADLYWFDSDWFRCLTGTRVDLSMFDKLFDGSLMPHGHCLLWRGDLLFLHISGDILIALSYAFIRLALVYIVHKRDDLKFDRLFWLFAAFIFSCGITHVIGLVNIWHGYYFIAGVAKFVTGVISAITAVILLKLVPSILKIPSTRDLELSNQALLTLKEELVSTNKTLEERVQLRTQELELLARTDTLTGISNRREIIRLGHREFARAQRYQRNFSVIMIDIDFFKQINDSKGHQAGDDALIHVAQTLQGCCRATDYLGRYGGEEFLMICLETDTNAAFQLAERCRIAVMELVNEPRITVSLGVADIGNGMDLESLIFDADAALYAAKEQGRNRVFCHPRQSKS